MVNGLFVGKELLEGVVVVVVVVWVPISFPLYHFSLLLFVAYCTVVFVVDNDCQKRKLSGTDRKSVTLFSRLSVCWMRPGNLPACQRGSMKQQEQKEQEQQQQP